MVIQPFVSPENRMFGTNAMSHSAKAALAPAPPTVPWHLLAPSAAPGVSEPKVAASGLGDVERQAAALRVARLKGHAELSGSYAAALSAAGGSPALVAAVEDNEPDGMPGRMAAIMRYVSLVAKDPRALRCADIEALKRQGLAFADITELTRLVVFVAYEAGILGDLGLGEAWP